MSLGRLLRFVVPAALAAASLATPAWGVVPNCAPETVVGAATGGRKVFLQRALTYYNWAPDYSQSACLNIQTGDVEPTGPSCDAPTWWRTDCSGFVSSVWNLSTSYSTAWLADGGTDANGNTWVTKGWDELEPGDAINYPGDHIALFTGWLDDAHTSFCVMEEASPGWTDAWGGLGCIADTYEVATAQANGFFPLGLAVVPGSPAEGALDGADCLTVRGWAVDPDAPDQAVVVDLVADAPLGDPASLALGSVLADASRADLCTSLGSCDHAFEATTPAALLDGATHTLYAYAHGASGTVVLLGDGPTSFACTDPPSGGASGSGGGPRAGAARADTASRRATTPARSADARSPSDRAMAARRRCSRRSGSCSGRDGASGRPPRADADVRGATHRWNARVCEASAVLWPLRDVASAFSGLGDWPTVRDLDLALRDRARVGFVAASPRSRRRAQSIDPALLYDARICVDGVVPTRERSWHDLLNALVWATFPESKRALHARQHRATAARLEPGARVLPGARTREQDCLAQVDEGGAVLVCRANVAAQATESLGLGDIDALAGFVAAGAAAGVVFGHAIHEHAATSRPLPRALVHVVAVATMPEDAGALIRLADASLAQELATEGSFPEPSRARTLAVTEPVFGRPPIR